MISKEELVTNLRAVISSPRTVNRVILPPTNTVGIMLPRKPLYEMNLTADQLTAAMLLHKAVVKGMGTLVYKRNEKLLQVVKDYFQGYFNSAEAVGDFTPYNNPFVNYLNYCQHSMAVVIKQNIFYSEENNSLALFIRENEPFYVKLPSVVPVIMKKLRALVQEQYDPVNFDVYIPRDLLDRAIAEWQAENRKKKAALKASREIRKAVKKNVPNSASASR